MSATIQPMILHHSDGLATDSEPPLIHPIMACYGLTAIVLILVTIIFVYLVGNSTSWKVYKHSWFWLDLCMIVLTSITLTVTFQTLTMISALFEKIDQMKVNEFLSIQSVTYWYGIEASMVCLTQSFCFFRIWKLVMHSESKFMVTSLMLKLSYESLSGYVLIIGIFVTAFAWMGFVAFGNSLEAFHSMWTSYASLLDEVSWITKFEIVHDRWRMHFHGNVLYLLCFSCYLSTFTKKFSKRIEFWALCTPLGMHCSYSSLFLTYLSQFWTKDWPMRKE